MAWIDGKQVAAFFVGVSPRAARSVTVLYSGALKIWEALSNCIAGGWWQRGHGWQRGTGWGERRTK